MVHHVPLISYGVVSKGPVPSGLMLDNGVALMATRLHKQNYTPKVFDYNNTRSIRSISENGKEGFLEETISELGDYVSSTGSKMVGLKLYTNGFVDSARIAFELKERFPDLFIFAGGPHVEWFEKRIFNYMEDNYGRPIFDALVHGDADISLPMIADLVYKNGIGLNHIPGIITNNGLNTAKRAIAITNIPFPIYDPEVYDTTGKILIPVIEGSRSCGMPCSFCIHSTIGMEYRQRDINDLLSEIEHNEKEYGFVRSRLADPRPTARYLNKLFRELDSRFKISAFSYSDQRYDFDLAQDKLIGVFVGLETGNADLLRSYGKSKKPEKYYADFEEMITQAKERGIATSTSITMPCPFETEKTKEETFDLLTRVQPDSVPVNPIVPIPGARLYDNAKQNGELSGVVLEENHERIMMELEIDLLKPMNLWTKLPHGVVVNGELCMDPVKEHTGPFVMRLSEQGMVPLSDEQFLMAHAYHNGLSMDQDERRRQTIEVNNGIRNSIVKGEIDDLEKMIAQINFNNTCRI